MAKTIFMVFAVVTILAGSIRAADGYQAPELEAGFPLKALGATAACLFGLVLCVLKDAKRSFREDES